MPERSSSTLGHVVTPDTNIKRMGSNMHTYNEGNNVVDAFVGDVYAVDGLDLVPDRELA